MLMMMWYSKRLPENCGHSCKEYDGKGNTTCMLCDKVLDKKNDKP